MIALFDDLARPDCTVTDAWWATTAWMPEHADMTSNPMDAEQCCSCGLVESDYDAELPTSAVSRMFEHRLPFAVAYLQAAGVLTDGQASVVAAAWSEEYDGLWADLLMVGEAVSRPADVG